MSIKMDRDIYVDRIDCYINETGDKGQICVLSTAGSGVALDNTSQLVTIAAAPSGKVVAGVLMQEVVDIDSTREFLNTQKDQVDKGGKVNLAKKGWIVTDNVEGNITAGEKAYVGESGQFANETAMLTIGAISDFQEIGRFDTSKDENDYVRITLEIV